LEDFRGSVALLRPILLEIRLAGVINVDIPRLTYRLRGPLLTLLSIWGLVPIDAGENDVKRKTREIAERYGVSPMFFGQRAFLLGNMYCKEKLCDLCPIGHVCPKVDMR